MGCRPDDVNEIKDFAEQILKLGKENDGEVKIDIPDEMIIKDSNYSVASIINFTYQNILYNLDDYKYFIEKAIIPLYKRGCRHYKRSIVFGYSR